MPQILQFALILAVILVLVGVFVVALRRLTGGKLVSAEAERSRNRQPRLGVVDVYDLDRTRQLVLLRRDNVEHLLLIGGPNDVVIESNIVRVASGKTGTVPQDMLFERPELPVETAGRMIPEQQTRPTVESGAFRQSVSEQQPFAQVPEAAAIEPAVPPPYHAPAQESAPSQQATIAAASFAAVAAATQYGHEVAESVEADVPDFLRGHYGSRQPAPAPAATPEPPVWPVRQPERTEPVETLPPLRQSPELTSFGAFHTQPPAAEPEPPKEDDQSKYDFTFGGLTNPIGGYADTLPSDHVPARQDPVFEPEPAAETAPMPEPELPVERAEEVPPPAPPASEKPIQINETLLSDMARQLEEALRGSAAPAPLVAAEPEAAAPVTHVAEEAAEAEPVIESAVIETLRTEIAEAVAAPAPVEQPQEEPVKATETIAKGAAEPEVASEPRPLPEKAKPATEVAASPETRPSPASRPAAESEQAGEAKSSSDPFSLDDIEAEFARLLGRTDDKADKS